MHLPNASLRTIQKQNLDRKPAFLRLVSPCNENKSKISLSDSHNNNSSPKLPFLSSNHEERMVEICFSSSHLNQEQIERLTQLSHVTHPDNAALKKFSGNIGYIKNNVGRFINYDPQIGGIVRVIEGDVSRIIIASINDKGIEISKKDCYLNLDVFLSLAEFAHQSVDIPDEWLGMALSIYFFHEVNHASQGIARHEDVKAVKSINEAYGRKIITALDLRSDYLAAHTMAILSTLRCGAFSRPLYKENFYKIWCHVCRGTLQAFPSKHRLRKGDIQRILGYLLMSHLIKDSSHKNSPLFIEGELLPDWCRDMTRINISMNQRPWISGLEVDPRNMQQAINSIRKGEYDQAEEEVGSILRCLPLTAT